MKEIKNSEELKKELQEQRQIAQEAFNYAVYISGKIRKAKNLAITATVIGIASICLDIATIAFMH